MLSQSSHDVLNINYGIVDDDPDTLALVSRLIAQGSLAFEPGTDAS